MKNLLFFALFSLLFSKNLPAQVSKVMPPDANDFYNKSMPLLRPQVKNIVLQNARAIENRKINSDSLSQALHRNPALKGMSNNDIEGILVLIMVQASKDADADLKKMVLEISRKNDQKKETASNSETRGKKESQDNNNETQNLKLQMIMNRKSDMAEEVSYVMKKISGTQQNIINNLK
jgi:hypothetical protein